MTNHKHHISVRLAVLLLAFTLVLPSLVKLSHALQHDHDHDVCIEKDQVHFHELEYDCEFYKFNINHSLFFELYEYEVKSSSEANTSEITYYTFLNSHQQLTSYLRGPPHLLS